MRDYKELATSTRVIEATKAQTGVSDFKGFDISVSALSNTRIIEIAVRGEDPVQTADVANAIARNLSDCIMEVMKVENISVIDSASPPISPSGPDKTTNILLAAAIAFAFSVALALILEITRHKNKNG